MKQLPEVIYEDDFFCVINKPSNIHCTSQENGSISDLTIVDFIKSIYKNTSGISDNDTEAGLLNRLDFETSGVLLAARKREEWVRIKTLFKTHQVQKIYQVLVDGAVKECPSHIEGYLGSRYRNSKKVQCTSHSKKRFLYAHTIITDIRKLVVRVKQPHICDSRKGEKQSLLEANEHSYSTDYKVDGADERLQFVFDENRHFSLLHLSSTTGRRHQVRAQLAWRGHPLTGDVLYGSKYAFSDVMSCVNLNIESEIPSFLLHAFSISFQDYQGVVRSFSINNELVTALNS
jgi:23S rRNA-/tRNA-specific pseudouridylate synthase